DGVDLQLAGAVPMRARYLVAADGGRSTIRKAAGIDFPGWDATRSTLIAEVEVTEQQVGPAADPTPADLSNALLAVYDTDFGIRNPISISRFSDATRQAAVYRAGRVLLAG